MKSLEVEVDYLSEFDVIFWDFDGVVKESVQVKAEAYDALFHTYGNEVQQKVREHHLQHGGMSRYDKIPFYFKKLDPMPMGEEEPSKTVGVGMK